jgi:hypothetical protein
MRRGLLALTIVLVLHWPPSPGRADERSTARRFEAARGDEPSLIAFLRAMPKGADLHNHLGGSLYGEEGLRQAIRHQLYFNPTTTRFETQKSDQNVPAEQLLRDDRLRYQFLNAVSVRGGVDNGPAGGHDHFFRAFGPLGSALQGTSEVEGIAGGVREARLQNIQYLELMQGPGGRAMGPLLAAAAPDGSPEQWMEKLQPLLGSFVTAARGELDAWDQAVAAEPGAAGLLSAADRPVTVRYLVTAIRTQPDERIFATWAAAFALMRADPRVVGVNFAAPEDHPVAREGLERQMRLLDFLWRRFERPNITLHAGELNLFVSPLEPMTYPIRRSIEIGHARRIGHGTAVAWESDVEGLLHKMRDEGIAVEVCPTSEAVILGVEGDRHPFRLYHRAGVPLTLNTDDEGILRSNLTMEFVRAVRSWDLRYADVKELARNSVEYSFLPGESLFERRDYRRPRTPFRALKARGWSPTPEEKAILAKSDKAVVQARLERAFVEFER